MLHFTMMNKCVIFVSAYICLVVLTLEARADPELPEVGVEERSPTSYVNRRVYSYCYSNGRQYSHGQTFYSGTSRCLRYRCNRGRVENIQEACEMDGRCHRVGSYFTRQCVTYRCEKSNRGTHSYYQTTIFRRQCEDAQGRCRREGATFPKVLDGKYYRNCRCEIKDFKRSVYYSCD
ncbi:hypothetical protein ElyMa_002993900 [Elysia marginata]|uniref:Uncharacterized protein n=1 Tax=Elysia marginata TaxID=1093978 RepID=A0AAV4IDH3_9GAST|nr:hypothetical protein ElyMa_002993900 [Elysia marginata]